MFTVYLENGPRGVWKRFTEKESFGMNEESCDPVAELIAFAEMDLSFLAPLQEELAAEAAALRDLDWPSRVKGFLPFRRCVLGVYETLSQMDAILGRLCMQYLSRNESPAYFIPDDRFESHCVVDKRHVCVSDKDEDCEEDYMDADDLQDAIKRGLDLIGNVLQAYLSADFAMTALTSQVPGLFDGFFSVRVIQELARPMYGAARYEGGLSRRYVFEDPWTYYRFLAVLTADPAHPLHSCDYCGKPFLPRSRRTTKYCERIQPNGRTCRQLGPANSHRMEVEEDPVIEAFDRAKRRMYKRMERTDLDMADIATLSMTEYCDWLATAEDTRAKYRAGMLSQEEALQILEGDNAGKRKRHPANQPNQHAVDKAQ